MITKDTILFVKEIPFNFPLPKKLKLTPQTKLFIYIPNFNEIQLSQGKNFENGFWSISYEELENIKFLTTKNISFFQFLIIHKNPSQEEIVSNFYYQNESFISGPFINAEFTIINETSINIRIKCLCNPDETTFEIAGIPDDGILSFGEKMDDGTWIINNIYCKNLLLKLDKNDKRKKLNLSITGINKNNPHFNTTFNLIINLKEPILPYRTKYKEIKIPAKEILIQSKLRFDKYILSVKNLPENCCVENATIVDNKWIVEDKKNEEITLEYFNLETKELLVNLEYILINKDYPTIDNIYSKKIKYNLEDKEIKTKNYTKCVTCKNLTKCTLFKEFMDYIGNTTILRHILPK